ncbi:MAG: hypothetical protein CVV28_02405 [Methanobacteriales archaeon HGW-Methanobacteriales-1]|jgi:hypothetical protein|nr:MAG: hypothetical protein CVV28_02405 [Methanobacteriales archaeon HGW-Methanobacteriales-1]
MEEKTVAMKLAEDMEAIRNGMQTMLDAGLDMETLIILIDAKIPKSKSVGKNRVRAVLEAQKKVLDELGQLTG